MALSATYIEDMKKRVVDLTPEELDRLAGDAWFEASRAALRAGAPVVGREGDKIIRTYPDNRKEVLGPATPLAEYFPVTKKATRPNTIRKVTAAKRVKGSDEKSDSNSPSARLSARKARRATDTKGPR
jgi:hypothetical protein